jgi:hypothetical protein
LSFRRSRLASKVPPLEMRTSPSSPAAAFATKTSDTIA